MGRFIGVLPLNRAMDQSGAGHWKASARAAGLAPLFTQPSIEIWSSELTSVALGPGGLILGSIFADNGTTDREWLQGSARRIAESRGSELLSRWWGSFVAFLVGDGCCDIIRAPFGTLPVLYARGGGQLFVASDVELLRACGYSATVIDWTELARHLTAGEIRRSATCLADVSELRGGMRLTVSAETVSVSELWTPWRAAARARCPEPVDRSQRLLVSTVDRCTAAIAKSVRRPLLLLSGGLDSSILAASLAHSDQIFSALTFTTTEPAGDERRYARAVAGALTFDLIEAERRLDNVDVTRSDSARLPRPARRSFLQDSRKLTEEVGAACDADLVLEGGGGDNVFCLLQSVTPVVDRLLAGEGWRAAFASARDVAELTEATALEVCARALHRAVLRRSAIRTPLDRSFLTAAAAEAARDASHHPWLVPPLGAWPGSAAHIALLVAAQSWSESFDPLAAIATECPLLARPVVEACLAVPSWRWFDRGQNRVVAREAFRSRLPALVVDRRSKATPDSFVTRLYERNRGIIRELLLDGKLAANGLLDRDALDKALSIMGPQRDHDHRRIMRIADAEAWARAQVR